MPGNISLDGMVMEIPNSTGKSKRTKNKSPIPYKNRGET